MIQIIQKQARYYALGQTRTGSYHDPCDWVFSEVRGGANCAEINPRFWYSGDPITDYGWINIINGDQRTLTSTEMFNLVKDEPMDIIVAYVVGQGSDALKLNYTRKRNYAIRS
ncbi:MAG: hypothetical protein U5K00_17865 [Melioribacteraceae bacterium]|nr:hypothetical protein [Melioribacteraceae bacterium]